jgi:predicted enzyme related to lactoylglutathione lyase
VLTEDEEVVRLVDTSGNTLVLHVVEHEHERSTRGLRLYFAVPRADEIVERIQTAHPEVTVLQPVELMPWGRRHAYLLDPDGWELSVYERQEGTR